MCSHRIVRRNFYHRGVPWTAHTQSEFLLRIDMDRSRHPIVVQVSSDISVWVATYFVSTIYNQYNIIHTYKYIF